MKLKSTSTVNNFEKVFDKEITNNFNAHNDW